MPTLGTIPIRIRKSGSTKTQTPPGGWVGSKAGKKGDLVTLDSNGRVDQVVAAGNHITSASDTLAYLSQARVVGDAQGTLTQIDKFDEDTLLAVPACTVSGTTPTAVATTNAMIGQQYPLLRDASSNLCLNTSTNTNPVCEVVDWSRDYKIGEVGGILLVRILPSQRVA